MRRMPTSSLLAFCDTLGGGRRGALVNGGSEVSWLGTVGAFEGTTKSYTEFIVVRNWKHEVSVPQGIPIPCLYLPAGIPS